MLTGEHLHELRALIAGPPGADPAMVIHMERRTVLAVLDELLAAREARRWRPVADAPRDADVLLWMTSYGGCVRIGRFDDDRYARRPRPFWRAWSDDISTCRAGQPTHYMPLPEPRTEGATHA